MNDTNINYDYNPEVEDLERDLRSARMDIDAALSQWRKLESENKRLREGLEKIANKSGTMSVRSLKLIAKEALKQKD